MESKSKFEEDIIKRLDILIALVLRGSSTEATVSMTDQIGKLADIGVPSADIARILGKPLNYVTASRSQRKSRKKAKANG